MNGKWRSSTAYYSGAMDRLRPWLDAAKPELASIPALAVAVGCACARFDARAPDGVVPLLIAGIAALAAAIGVNLVDHAWDAPAAPPPDPKDPPPESERMVSAREAGIAAAAALQLAGVLGLLLAPLTGAAPLGYGAAAVGLGLWRRAPAAGADTLGYGLGELATIVALGPLAVSAGFASQAGEGSATALYAGVPVGLAAASAAFLRHFTRRDADRVLQRMTPVDALGESHAALCAVAYPLGAAAAILLVRRAGEYPASSWIAGLPLAVFALIAGWRLRGGVVDHDLPRLERLALAGAAATLVLLAITLLVGASP
jgi:1,4-dihydroxy-2-naphthoate octaprenyltransferase